MTTEGLAGKAGLSVASLHEIEDNARVSRSDAVHSIAAALGLSPDDLVIPDPEPDDSGQR